MLRNFHLPLPEETYGRLREAAARAQVPATALAREAIDAWLREQARESRRRDIAAWARQMAGTSLDLDPVLEAAGLDSIGNETMGEKSAGKIRRLRKAG